MEHYFRHEYGRLVAVLSRQVGINNIEIVEDSVQFALMKALNLWTVSGLPDNSTAWLYRVARNALLGELRQRNGHQRILEQFGTESISHSEDTAQHWLAGELKDNLLRMMFVCCDDSISIESQLVFALKTLCGFSTSEIAVRLFTSQANVYKRLARARAQLKTADLALDLSPEQQASRLTAVHKTLYLLFTEGYLSSHAQDAIRQELCDEAIRLSALLAEHPIGNTPATLALLALMHLHAARLPARQDGSGGLLLLEEQDRSRWDHQRIQMGLQLLAHSAVGEQYSQFHAEAGIAAEHCLAPSFNETRWDKIATGYLLLEQTVDSPLHRLNRAVALAQWQGPAAGLAILSDFEPPAWLARSYMWSAVLSDLHRRDGSAEMATHYRSAALRSAPSAAVKQLLERRLILEAPACGAKK